MLLNDAVNESQKIIDIKIFATDVDEVSIDIASKGIYPPAIGKDIHQNFIKKYFVNNGQSLQIVQKIRKQIVFAKHDVIRDPPFINNDLVSCRNMLIYVSPYLQQKIFSVLIFSVVKNGHLFLGPSEHSTYIKDFVDEISSKWKLYKKIKDSKITNQYLAHISERTGGREYKKSTGSFAEKPKPIWEALRAAISEELNIAAFLIDSSFTIRESIGNYENFLSLPKKTLQLNLLNMIRQELYFVLSTEIKGCGKKVTPQPLKIYASGKMQKLISGRFTLNR